MELPLRGPSLRSGFRQRARTPAMRLNFDSCGQNQPALAQHDNYLTPFLLSAALPTPSLLIPANLTRTEQLAMARLHVSEALVELKSSLRESLDIRRTAREYLLPAAGAAAFLGLLLGYGLAGMFTRR